MFFDEGKKKVSLRGNSGQEKREVLLERAKKEREQRAKERSRLRGATLLQALYRGRRVADLWRNELRSQFDSLLLSISSSSSQSSSMIIDGSSPLPITNDIGRQLLQLSAFALRPAEHPSDRKRLTNFCSVLLSESRSSSTPLLALLASWCNLSEKSDASTDLSTLIFHISRLSVSCCSYIQSFVTSEDSAISAPILSVLKQLLSPSTYPRLFPPSSAEIAKRFTSSLAFSLFQNGFGQVLQSIALAAPSQQPLFRDVFSLCSQLLSSIASSSASSQRSVIFTAFARQVLSIPSLLTAHPFLVPDMLSIFPTLCRILSSNMKEKLQPSAAAADSLPILDRTQELFFLGNWFDLGKRFFVSSPSSELLPMYWMIANDLIQSGSSLRGFFEAYLHKQTSDGLKIFEDEAQEQNVDMEESKASASSSSPSPPSSSSSLIALPASSAPASTESACLNTFNKQTTKRTSSLPAAMPPHFPSWKPSSAQSNELSKQLPILFEPAFLRAVFVPLLSALQSKKPSPVLAPSSAPPQPSASSSFPFSIGNPFSMPSSPAPAPAAAASFPNPFGIQSRSPFSAVHSPAPSPTPSPFSVSSSSTPFSLVSSASSANPFAVASKAAASAIASPAPAALTPTEEGASAACALYASIFRHLHHSSSSSELLSTVRLSALNNLSFVQGLIRSLWAVVQSEFPSASAASTFIPSVTSLSSSLVLFALTLGHVLEVIDDDEFSDGVSLMPRDDMGKAALLVRDLAFQSHWNAGFLPSSASTTSAASSMALSDPYLRDSLTQLARKLYDRDCRRRFLPASSWQVRELDTEWFAQSHSISGEDLISFAPASASSSSASPIKHRTLSVLRSLPFLIPFDQRVRIFHTFVEQDNEANRNPMEFIHPPPTHDVRRTYLVEDAFSALNRLGSDLRHNDIRVRFINEHGEAEAGFGHGVTKEFISELCKAAFNPQFGLFVSSPQNLLYPNPSSHLVAPNHLELFEFLGRVLGKAMRDSILVDLPFARFFLSKLLGKMNYFNDLASLDPELHRNLLFLKRYEGAVEDLALSFSVSVNDFGQQSIVDLVPHGRDVVVTRENRLQYIHRLAHYRLNLQIRAQAQAFLTGFVDMVPQQWLTLFSPEELQILISGASSSFDVEDLRAHTVFSGGFDETHPTIGHFWQALSELNEEEKGKFLRFVTSVPRAPLMGFRHMNPKMCIHKAGDDPERLPTSATCLNLLKLPAYRTLSQLKQKLKLAISSASGFDLS